MADDRLTPFERFVLLVLMAQARELTNAELQGAAGIRLDGKARRRLNDLGLVTSTRIGNAYVHELTDRGAVWCSDELARERPERSGTAGGALYSVLAGLRRYLDESGLTLADVFLPNTTGQVEAAYTALSRGKGTPVRLAVLRERLDQVPADEFDRALTRLARREDVHVRSEADQKTLTAEDADAAVVLAGTARHLLMIEVPQ